MAVAISKEFTGMAAGSVTVGEISTLHHEILDDSMEDNIVIFIILSEQGEVFNVNWSVSSEEFNHHISTSSSAVVVGPSERECGFSGQAFLRCIGGDVDAR